MRSACHADFLAALVSAVAASGAQAQDSELSYYDLAAPTKLALLVASDTSEDWSEFHRDVESAAEWYEEESGSGARFVARVQEVLNRIGPMPEFYLIARRDVQRARVSKFPYNRYDRILADRVEILDVVHGRREPLVWQSRA